MSPEWLDFFTDPVLRAPTLGSMLMGLAAGLVGVIVYLRKESLLGETLSHAAFPGAIFGALAAGTLALNENLSTITILAGAGITALLSIYLIHCLETRLRIPSDSALCFILAATFGIGVAVASHIQFTHAGLYRRLLSLLYGQAATMTDFHVYLYGALAILILGLIFLFRKEIAISAFDRTYGKSLGIPIRFVEGLFFCLIVLAVIIGIRTVGVVLMSAMLIAPPVAARQFTHHLATMFGLAGLLGIVTGFAGNYFSVTSSYALAAAYPGSKLSLPTGPMIVLAGALICITALMFAPERGLLPRAWRIARFRYRRLCENILKCAWRYSSNGSVTVEDLKKHLSAGTIVLRIALSSLTRQGWLKKYNHSWKLTKDGEARASRIVRLHRLWEVYLADYLGLGSERVHRSAEEMEHIITPQLEAALTQLLKDPQVDPHSQPIPQASKGI